MKKTSLAAFAAIVLGGCQFVPGTSAHQIAEAKKAVASEMKDPTAPLFSEIKTTEDGVCGYVNGKNSYGAYAGKTRFTWRKNEVLIEGGDHSNPGVRAADACMLEAMFAGCQEGKRLLTVSVENNMRCSAEGEAAIKALYRIPG